MTFVVTLLSLLVSLNGYAAKITYTFDDAPMGDHYLSGVERTERLIIALKNAKVEEAAFYANPGKKYKFGIDRLKKYSKAGHVLANHTFDHPSLDKISAENFLESIHSAHKLIKDLPTFRPWFRYPYLREGKGNPNKHDRIKSELSKLGYRLGYITIETFDWHIQFRLNEALKARKKVHFDRLGKFYRRLVVESALFYESLAKRNIGRSPVHVLLLHENDINALFFEDVVKDLEEAGFETAKASEAFSDPIADKKWDNNPRSMTRLRAIAEKSNYSGPVDSHWLSEKTIDQEMARLAIFE